MEAEVLTSTSKEVKLSLKDFDIATLYITQHELLKNSAVTFAGVVVKHPLTNECWMRISSKTDPLKEISKATDIAIKIAEDLKKSISSKLKAN
jgi:DNA-directed RNA polymerase subunit L